MSSMRHSSSLVNLLDKRLHQLPTSKMMKISKPNLVKKAVTAFKSKTDALRTKLIILTSLRRRMAMVCAASRQIHGLVASGGAGIGRLRWSITPMLSLCTRWKRQRAKS
ncbi:unnamed protein product [Urochloa humidicola]